MITIDIHGYGRLEIAHFVSDFSGTLSEDGSLIPGVTTAVPVGNAPPVPERHFKGPRGGLHALQAKLT